jgi:hypothetical protein
VPERNVVQIGPNWPELVRINSRCRLHEPERAKITSNARVHPYRDGMKSFSSTIPKTISKTISKTILLSAATLALGANLSACSSAPATVPIDPLEFTLPAALPTLGQVIFPAASASFQKSPVSFTTVSLTGNAAATNVLLAVKANIYARTTDPSTDCTKVTVDTTSVYICSASTQTKVSSQSITLASDGSKTAFKLEDNNGVLKEAMTGGKLWVGLEFAEGLAANSKVKFSEMVASLAVF